MRTEELRHELAEMANDQRVNTGDASAVVARGRRRLLRRRFGVGVVALAVVGASVGIVVSTQHTTHRGVVITNPPTSVATVAPRPTTAGAPVMFTSASEGWVCGDPMLHTADGGAHWQAAALARFATGTVTCAVVPNEALIFVQSRDGVVTLLPDQGGGDIAVTIGFPRLPAGARIAQATFVDVDDGWVLARPADAKPGHGLLYRTTTGTGPIRFDLVSSAAPIGHLQFVSATEGWGTDGGSIAHTTDGGATWTTVVAPRTTVADQRELFDAIAVRGPTIAVEGVDANLSGTVARPFFFVSADSGNTWTRLAGPPAAAPLSAAVTLETVDAEQWRFMFGGRIWATGDAARTWTEIAAPPHLASISYPTIESNWATLANGAVYRWSDAGPHWEKVDTTSQPPWYSLLVDVPGNPGSCPTIARPTTIDQVTSDHDAAVAAARDFVRATRGWTAEEVEAAYPVTQPGGGQYGVVFSTNVPRQCGQAVADASWGVELGNPVVSQDSSRTTALVVAPVAGVWKVWGFYR